MDEFQELEEALREEAKAIAEAGDDWRAEQVARRLMEIADQLTRMRHRHQGGIDASMGKRSGLPPIEI